VLVEGNSFLDYVSADFAIMCARGGENKLKTSARRTLEKADAVYLSIIDDLDRETAIEQFDKWRAGLGVELNLNGVPMFTREDISQLVDCIHGSLRLPVMVNV